MRTSIITHVALVVVLAAVSNSCDAQQYQSNAWELSDWSPQNAHALAYSAQANSDDAALTTLDGQAAEFDAASAVQNSIVNGQDAQSSGQANQSSSQDATAPAFSQVPGLTSSIEDPVVNLQDTRLLREQAKLPGDALFSTSPLTPIRKAFIAREKRIYEAIGQTNVDLPDS